MSQDADATATHSLGQVGFVVQRKVARLHIVYPDPVARSVRLLEEDVVLGRQPKPGIAIDHSTVSRRHIALRFDRKQDRFTVEDLGSRNGSRLNGQRLRPETPAVLQDGAVLRIGGLLAVFERSGDEAGRPLPPGRQPRIHGVSNITAALRKAIHLA
ncbi:MAG: FHA domain-containing protein, partial [Myxococcota bacterium]